MVVHAAVVSPIVVQVAVVSLIVVQVAVVSPIVVHAAIVSPIVVQVAVVSPVVVHAAIVSPAVVQAVAVLVSVNSKQVREREGNESVPAQKSRLSNRLFCVFRKIRKYNLSSLFRFSYTLRQYIFFMFFARRAQKRASLQKFTSTWWSGL
ncbi:hypothetical protein [Ectobacillus funiculus]|uniref:hypothetical protein n=1 Tax=Ectobacillus funiculus TaxID=137993 RepID=UPI00101C8C01|nr:hypothetical protein [Ectobacillus funiculus]